MASGCSAGASASAPVGGGLLLRAAWVSAGWLFGPEAVGNGAVKGLCFFRVLDGLAVLAKVPCIALDCHVQAVRLACKIGGNVFRVGEGLDFDFRVLLVPLVRGGPACPGCSQRRKWARSKCYPLLVSEFAVALDAPEAVIPAAPIRIAGGVLDEVKAVVILEVCAGDLHHVAGFHGAVVLVVHGKTS